MRTLMSVTIKASKPLAVTIKDVTITFPGGDVQVGNATVCEGILTLNGVSAPLAKLQYAIRSSHTGMPVEFVTL